MASPSSSTGKGKEVQVKKEEDSDFEKEELEVKKEEEDYELEIKKEEDNESEEKKEEVKMNNKKFKSENIDMHVTLDDELILYLKNLKNWPEELKMKSDWTVTEEEIEDMSMRTYDLDYVIKNHLLDEEIVWDDDVWGLQNFTKIIPNSHPEEVNIKNNEFEIKKEKMDNESQEKKEDDNELIGDKEREGERIRREKRRR